MRRVRLVGGPRHSEIIALPNYDRFVVPVRREYTPFVHADQYSEYHPMYDEVIYERRVVQFDRWARIEVFAARDMSDAEFYRRIADLVEGVSEPAKR